MLRVCKCSLLFDFILKVDLKQKMTIHMKVGGINKNVISIDHWPKYRLIHTWFYLKMRLSWPNGWSITGQSLLGSMPKCCSFILVEFLIRTNGCVNSPSIILIMEYLLLVMELAKQELREKLCHFGLLKTVGEAVGENM